MRELITDNIVLATADALNRYDTSGLCPLRGACELCDCWKEMASPEQIERNYRQALDRARYALEAAAPLIAARAERLVATARNWPSKPPAGGNHG